MDAGLLSPLWPAGVVSLCASPIAGAGHEDVLAPVERAAIADAVPSRRTEFITGRWLARRALTQLGLQVEAIAVGADRAPVWPRGVVGSITHTRRLCAVAVARGDRFAAIGLDAEPVEALSPQVLDEVTRPSERQWLVTLPEAERGETARLVFAIKECVYKTQYPIARRFLDFADVELTTPIGEGTWTASILRPDAPTQLSGRWARAQGHWLSTCALPAR